MTDEALPEGTAAQLRASMADEENRDSFNAAAEDWARSHGMADAPTEEKVAGYLAGLQQGERLPGSDDLP